MRLVLRKKVSSKTKYFVKSRKCSIAKLASQRNQKTSPWNFSRKTKSVNIVSTKSIATLKRTFLRQKTLAWSTFTIKSRPKISYRQQGETVAKRKLLWSTRWQPTLTFILELRIFLRRWPNSRNERPFSLRHSDWRTRRQSRTSKLDYSWWTWTIWSTKSF